MNEKGSAEAHSRLVKECLEELALMGYPAWANRTASGEMHGTFMQFGKKGSGDIIGLLPPGGKHLECECKTGAAVQSKRQKTHMRVVRNGGGIYLVIRHRREIPAQLASLGFEPRNPDYRPSPGAVLLL